VQLGCCQIFEAVEGTKKHIKTYIVLSDYN
jgi:hypothetical protein